MRIAGLVLGILGGLASGALGMKWLSDAEQYKESLELAAQLGVDVGGLVTAAWLLVLAFFGGIVGGVLALKGKGKHAAAVMITAGVAPAIFEPKALIFSFLLIIAGAVSLGAKRR